MSQKTAKNIIAQSIWQLERGQVWDEAQIIADRIIVGLLAEGFRIIPKHRLQVDFTKVGATTPAAAPAEAAQHVLDPSSVDVKALVASLSVSTLLGLIAFIARRPPIEARKLDPILLAVEAEIQNGGYA